VAERSITPRPDGSWWVADQDGAGQAAHAVTDADGAVWVHVAGEVIVVPATERRRTRAASHASASLEAPMPAQVLSVVVGVGDQVAAGAPLILLEAMKMELPLRAPVASRVVAVHCAAGDRVAPGRPLVDLEPAKDEP
jgi:biotin carboxyl carrier protein